MVTSKPLAETEYSAQDMAVIQASARSHYLREKHRLQELNWLYHHPVRSGHVFCTVTQKRWFILKKVTLLDFPVLAREEESAIGAVHLELQKRAKDRRHVTYEITHTEGWPAQLVSLRSGEQSPTSAAA